MTFKKCLYSGSMMHGEAGCCDSRKSQIMVSLYGGTKFPMAQVDPQDLLGMPVEKCPAHGVALGEGDICHVCESLGDALVAQLNAAMAEHPHQLWYVWNNRLYKTPVNTFNEAKQAYHELFMLGTGNEYSGIRIARMDPEQGCESVLHKFS